MSLPPFMQPETNQTKKNIARSRKQENKVASLFGGILTSRSGAGNDKGDVKAGGFRIECKTTEKQSMSVKAAWFSKIEAEALSEGKLPALALEIGDKQWFAIPERLFAEIKEYLERK